METVGMRSKAEIELEALTVLYGKLSVLSPAARLRVLKYLSELLGEEP